MGWIPENAPGHEGYVVAVIKEQVPIPAVDGRSIAVPQWRELSYYLDHDRPVPAGGLQVDAFQVGCECGWRSRRFLAPYRARWRPYVLELGDEQLEEAARDEWRSHLDHEQVRQRGASAAEVVALLPDPVCSRCLRRRSRHGATGRDFACPDGFVARAD